MVPDVKTNRGNGTTTLVESVVLREIGGRRTYLYPWQPFNVRFERRYNAESDPRQILGVGGVID